MAGEPQESPAALPHGLSVLGRGPVSRSPTGRVPGQSAGPATSVTVAECEAPSVPVQVTVTR